MALTQCPTIHLKRNYDFKSMNWPNTISPNMWALLGSFLILCVAGIYTWRHRDAPAAGPLLTLILLRGIWIIFRLLELWSTDPETKLLWFHLTWACLSFLVAIGISVIVEFIRPGTWLERRTFVLLYLPAAIVTVLTLTNPIHGLIWDDIWLDGLYRASRTPLVWIFALYFYCIGMLVAIRLIRFAVRWPLFRWSAVLFLLPWFLTIIVDTLYHFGVGAEMRIDPRNLTFNVVIIVFVLVAIVMRRMLDIVPVARGMAIKRMQDGIAVFDAQTKVVYQNPAAEALLSYPWQILGDEANATDLQALIRQAALRPTEIQVTLGTEQKQYSVQTTFLEDPRGWQLGDLMIFQDITERVRAQRLLNQQWQALAVLQERERIAGELHDDLGQVLGYVKLQTQVVRDLLSDKEYSGADSALLRLASVTQELHIDIREFILGVMTAAPFENGFALALEQYLVQLQTNFGLRTLLNISPTWEEASLEPVVTLQLLRIVQEALTNARKYAQVETVKVNLAVQDGQRVITIQDNGQGFDLHNMVESQELSFGLRFMRQRAQDIGGAVAVQSALGSGTLVTVSVPLQERQT